MDSQTHLERRLAHVVARFRRLRRNNPRLRPFNVELLGTPKSGKSTMAEAIEHTLKRSDWIVTARPEGATVVDRVKRDTPHYNLETCRYALSEVTQRLDSEFDLVVLDRGLMDGMVWMGYWFAKDKITQEDRDAVNAFYNTAILRSLFDMHVYLVCDPKVAMERELARSLSKKDGETMNMKTLTTLRGIHDVVWGWLGGDSDPRMALHDSSKERPEETARAVLEKLASAFERRLETLK
jgi:thymidylate kinase